MRSDFLYYDSICNKFLFKTTNPNVRKIYGLGRMATSDGFVWSLPGDFPDGYMALKDFTAVLPGVRAAKPAIERINYLKAVPDQVEDLTVVNTLELPFDRTPYSHQLEILEYMMHYPRLAILAEQGLGKTFIVLAYLYLMAQRLDRRFRGLVLAPRIVLRNWYEEAHNYTPLRPFLYRGCVDERAELREQLRGGNTTWDLVITNYEAVTPIESQNRDAKALPKRDIEVGDEVRFAAEKDWYQVTEVIPDGRYKAFMLKDYQGEQPVPQRNIDKGRRPLRSDNYLDDFNFFRKELDYESLVLDEGSRIKGHDSQRSKAVHTLACRVHYRMLLSGTISLGTPLDVFMPFNILNEQIFGANYYKFRRKYCQFSPYNKHVITGYKNLDVLKERMDPYIVSRTRKDCIDLPERIMEYRYYELTDEQREIYNQIINNEEIELNGRSISVELMVVKLTKLLQLLSGFMILPIERDDTLCNACEYLVDCLGDDIYPWNKRCAFHDTEAARAIKKPKREYFETRENPALRLLEEFLDEETGKVIIWAYYQKELQDIEALLNDRNISYIKADVEDCDVIYEKSSHIRVFLGQVSQGIGITLNSAKATYYYSQSLKLDDRLQSLDRNYRIGQDDKVRVIDALCLGTLQESVINLLRTKNDVKDFIQRRNECQTCERSMHCMERGIRPYSEKCLLYEERCNAETKAKLRIHEIAG